MWFLLTLVTIVAYCFYRWFENRCDGNCSLPPGPQGLPVLGYWLGDRPLETLQRLAKDFGPICRFRVLGKDYIHLGSCSAIREAYLKTGDAFVGRPHRESAVTWILDGRGISQGEGAEWIEHRRFVLHTLRDFNFGHLDVSEIVQEVADQLAGSVAERTLRPMDPLPLLTTSTLSVLAGLLFDRAQMPEGDEEFDTLLELITAASEYAFDYLPQLWKGIVPLKMRRNFSEIRRIKQELHDLLNQVIKEHEQSFNDSMLRDYLDVYLNERRRAEREGTLASSSFTMHHFRTICLDLLLSGTASTATWLHWALRIMAEHPKVQQRIQEEMDSLLCADDKFDSVVMRDNLPYTEATILEIHRFASVYSVAMLRTNPEATTLCGFGIPAKSVIIANLRLAHQDPEYWDNPGVFDPTRFLGEDGRPEKRDGFLPFSLGKRMCLGEALTKSVSFIFLTTLLKKFSFELCSTDETNSEEAETVLRSPGNYKLFVTPRVQTTTL
ncbi:cytochrome P450 2J1-like [Ornithodoros turicata]|uniref:cytochrome P450 2J1-like n=1 Tax=Ornithodoros turicata TaxID=34597 RepID=UPI003138E9E5